MTPPQAAPVCPKCGESVADYKGPCPKPAMTPPTALSDGEWLAEYLRNRFDNMANGGVAEQAARTIIDHFSEAARRLAGREQGPIGSPEWSLCGSIPADGTFHICRDSDTVAHYIIAMGLTLEQANRLADGHNDTISDTRRQFAEELVKWCEEMHLAKSLYPGEVAAHIRRLAGLP